MTLSYNSTICSIRNQFRKRDVVEKLQQRISNSLSIFVEFILIYLQEDTSSIWRDLNSPIQVRLGNSGIRVSPLGIGVGALLIMSLGYYSMSGPVAMVSTHEKVSMKGKDTAFQMYLQSYLGNLAS